MSQHSLDKLYNECGFPRVSGDEPSSFSQPSETVTFSPRERG